MDITLVQNNLPSKLEDLAQFVLVGREKLTAVRAGIRAIDKLELASDVRNQKKEEAQMLAEALLDAEAKIGEITIRMPKAKVNQHTKVPIDSGVERQQTKKEAIENLGFNQKQVERFETLAQNKDILEQVKAEAREADDLPTRTEVLKRVKDKKRVELTKEVAEQEVEIKEQVCKAGDVWKLGKHRLVCGDSTDKKAIDVLMDTKKADMVFTDPPYGMNLDTNYSDMVGFGQGGDYKAVIGDNDDFKPELIKTIFDNFGYCPEIFIWGADYFAELLPSRNDGSWIVWDKVATDKESTNKMFGSNFELCWSKAKHKRELARVLWKGFFGMAGEDTKNRVHPTQKPVELVKWFLGRYNGELIVDLYGGSGATLIACEDMGKKCYMMELDEEYCDIIIKRWENYTGEKALRLNDE